MRPLLLVLLTILLFGMVAQHNCVSAKRSLKNKHHLSDQELREIEAAWDEEDYDDMTPEQKKFAYTRDASGNLTPPGLQGKTEMVWVTIEKSPGVDFETKKEVDILANHWVDLMKSGGLIMSAFVMDNQKILYQVSDGFKVMMQLKNFLLSQPETKVFEWDHKEYYPKDKQPTEEELAAKKEAEKKEEEERSKARQAVFKKKEAEKKRDERRAARRAARLAKQQQDAETIDLDKNHNEL